MYIIIGNIISAILLTSMQVGIIFLTMRTVDFFVVRHKISIIAERVEGDTFRYEVKGKTYTKVIENCLTDKHRIWYYKINPKYSYLSLNAGRWEDDLKNSLRPGLLLFILHIINFYLGAK